MRRAPILAALLTATMLTACGGDDSPAGDTTGGGAPTTVTQRDATVTPPGTQPADTTEAPAATTAAGAVCGLLSEEAVSTIVGNPVVGVDIDATLCEYAPATGVPGTDGTAVDVFVNDAFDEACDLEFDLVGATNQQAVPDLGAAAYWNATPPQMYVCTGAKYVTVTMYVPGSVSDEDAFAQARNVAERVIAGL